MATLFKTEAARWVAVTYHDERAEGKFWYGVVTTGIYCRPTCASRPPRRANLRYFASPAEAEQAGFRPCKRCQPQTQTPAQPHLDAIRQCCRVIETTTPPPKLKELAQMAGLSPFHFQRVFKTIVGVTPKQYALMHQANQTREQLRQTTTVTEALSATGQSNRFHQENGMTPSAYQKGAPGQTLRYAIVKSALGWTLIAATARGLCAIEFGDTRAALEQRVRAHFPRAALQNADPVFTDWVSQVVALIKVPAQGLNLPLDIQGTAFQRRVWAALRRVPVGTTTTYTELAKRIGNPKAARAVARACATNPLAVAIPCHRVLRQDGAVSGYRWGVARKQKLLRREKKAC